MPYFARRKKAMNPENLRVAVQTEFVKRCKKNSAYSLRAYAKFLETDQSLLSKILRDERRISKKAAARLGAKLGIRPSEIAEKKETFLPLADDEFAAISEWYHFAILELFKTKGFAPTAAHVAKRLGLHITEAQAALERLHRLGIIRLEKKRATLNSKNNSFTNNAATTEARKLLQKRLLEKSLEAVELVPFAERDHGSLTVAIDPKRMPEFKEKLRQVRQELGEFFQPEGKGEEVYQLQISFFPLTRADRNV